MKIIPNYTHKVLFALFKFLYQTHEFAPEHQLSLYSLATAKNIERKNIFEVFVHDFPESKKSSNLSRGSHRKNTHCMQLCFHVYVPPLKHKKILSKSRLHFIFNGSMCMHTSEQLISKPLFNSNARDVSNLKLIHARYFCNALSSTCSALIAVSGKLCVLLVCIHLCFNSQIMSWMLSTGIFVTLATLCVLCCSGKKKHLKQIFKNVTGSPVSIM